MKQTKAEYTLSPLQEGMLFYTIRDANMGMYINQSVTVVEDLDVESLQAAWQCVCDRHDILKTSFHWQNLDYPMQSVHDKVEIPFYVIDWCKMSPDEQEQQFSNFLRKDRRQGFDLSEAPMFRVTLIRLSDNRWYNVFTHHHIIIDGWSGNLILNEVRQSYEANRFKQPLALLEPGQFGDYIRWINEQDSDKAQLFWTDCLSGFSAPTPLPADRGLTSNKGKAAADFRSWEMHIESEITRELSDYTRKMHITLNTLLQGAWALVLSRYSGLNDVVFGVLVSGRPPSLKGVESMVGMFLNTVPFRVRTVPNQEVAQWLKDLKMQQVELQEYEHSPLTMVRECSEVPTSEQLFSSVLSRKDTVGGGKKKINGGVSGNRNVKQNNMLQNYPLLLEAAMGDEIDITISYDAQRFKARSIAKLAEHLQAAMQSIVHDHTKRLGDVTLMSSSEYRQIVHDFNNTSSLYPRNLLLHQLFEQQAEKTPGAVAVRYRMTEITYRELNNNANRLAHYLRSKGAEPGVLIGFCLQRNLDMVTALLAVLKIGAAYVPLDPSFPLERLKYMLNDSQVSMILSQQVFIPNLPAEISDIICLDGDALWKEGATDNPQPVITPEHLAYILYTSGSTGAPKGVAGTHRGAVARIFSEHDQVLPHEAFCAKTTLNFIDSLWEFFLPWAHGLTTTLVEEETVRDPRALVESLANANVTRLVLVPSLLKAILETVDGLSRRLPKLKYWISSGEPLPGIVAEDFSRKLPGAVLVNIYGTSETWDLARSDSRERTSGEGVPIGKPIRNMRAYVLDESFAPTPIGIPGELFVGGDSVSRGYWRRPGLTAEKFIPDPFSEHGGDRLYRTGDLVQWMPDGNMNYLGRIDHQVKIRGFRIELEEIENILQRHASVRQAVVCGLDGEHLAAYLVAKETGIDVEELRIFATLHLPSYMLPTFYTVVPSIPHTPSGKIDKLTLQKNYSVEAVKLDAGKPFRQPSTETELLIADIWQTVLRVKKVGADDNFFDLGGHSLSAIRVVARLSQSIGRQISLQGVFEASTVAALARYIDEGKGERYAPQLECESSEDNNEAPLTYTQRRLWFLDQLNPGIASYTIPNMIHLRGEMDDNAMQRALRDILNRHEVLRSVIVSRGGEPVQIVQPTPDEIPVERIDISTAKTAERQQLARTYAREQGRLPWDLENGPLYRVQLITLSATEHILSTAFHHIIADGRSMGIFGRELGVLYHSHVHGQTLDLPPLPLQYADFARWERRMVQGDVFKKQMKFWKKALAGAAPLELITDQHRPMVHRFRGQKILFEIKPSVANALTLLAKENEATTFMWILAGFQVLLSKYSGQEDVIVGTAMWNRSRVEFEKLIGLFVNTIPIRTDLSGAPSFRSVLARLRKHCVDVFGNMDLPFEEMIRQITVDRDLSRQGSPLFQVMYIHQPGGQAQQGSIAPGVTIGKQRIDTGFSNFDLLLSTTDSQDGEISCMLSYDTDLFADDTIRRFVEHMQFFFEQVADKPDIPISNISLLSEVKEQKILSKWSINKTLPREKRCVHQLIAEVASKSPDKTALIFEGHQLSYLEMNGRARQLARHLLDLGVQPEQPIGLYMERGIEMIVGLLGIMNAGATVVSMDPAYPSERIDFMIESTGCSVVVIGTPGKDSRFVDRTGQVKHLVDAASWRNKTLGEQGDEKDVAPVHSRSMAYLIFTSGSTGTPKGVMVEHGNLANVIRSQIDQFGITDESRVLQMLSMSFDAAMGEIFRTLVAGGTLYLANREDLLPGPELIRLLQEHRITVTAMSPTALAAVPDASDKLPELTTLIVGGEPCPAKLAEKWQTGRRMLNGYGPTETTIGATLAVDWNPERKQPLGHPLPNVRLYALDTCFKPVPIGIPAELFISGVGVSRGYLKRPDATAERFLPDPFSEISGARMYRTGDLVRWLPDGQLEFLGRIDQQVKIRGYRIELGEIESVLGRHKVVEQCAVAVHEKEGVKRLVAYVTSKKYQAIPVDELKKFIRDKLPDYMVPSLIMQLSTLPVLPNGKVNRRALPEPDFSQLQTTAAYVAPESELEKSFAVIWKTVLGISRIGVNDNFFEIGGDSISSIQVVAKAAENGLTITARDMFQYQTIGEMVDALAKRT